MVQKRGYQAPSAKTVSVNENYSQRHGCFFAIVFYFAEVVTLGQFADTLGRRFSLAGMMKWADRAMIFAKWHSNKSPNPTIVNRPS